MAEQSQSRSDSEALKENEEVTHSSKGRLTEDQRACYELFCDLVGGEHHIGGRIKVWGRGLLWNMRNYSLASYDFDGLTRLVVMAHDRCIRVEVLPSGPGMIGISAHRRHKREGSMYERHPTMEQHVATLRGTEPVSERGRNDELPLSCEVEHDAIVIRVGAKAIAHATNINPALYDAESDCGQFRVSDPAAFAKEVHRELVREQEDGSTPLTRVLDQAVYEAINQGAEGVEEARPYERDR